MGFKYKVFPVYCQDPVPFSVLVEKPRIRQSTTLIQTCNSSQNNNHITKRSTKVAHRTRYIYGSVSTIVKLRFAFTHKRFRLKCVTPSFCARSRKAVAIWIGIRNTN